MKTSPQFVTPSDYFNYTGRELKAELQLRDNESNMDNIFLMRVEDDLMARVDAISFRIFPWEHLNDFQKECLQEAILLQAEYMIRYGNMFSDTGYDSERGFVADFSKIQQAALNPEAKDRLIKCGLLNHVIKNRKRFMHIDKF